MLADHPIHTPLPVTDLERAKRFYAEKLGLTPETELPDSRDGLFYRWGERDSSYFPHQRLLAATTHNDLANERHRGGCRRAPGAWRGL